MRDSTSGFAPRSDGVLAVVRELLRKLDEYDVTYCHWKSTAFLHRSLRGENDLDLLVHRDDANHFAQVLHGLGFKHARVRKDEVPGIADFYGYDPDADVVVHVHAHYRLVIGDDLTKNYRLPLEGVLLETRTRGGGLPVPAPETELFLLLIRLVVKHCTWDAVLLRRSRIPPAAREELSFLRARADDAKLRAIARDELPRVNDVLLAECVHALEPDADLRRRVRAGSLLTRALRPYARRPRTVDVGLKVGRFVASGTRRRLGVHPSRRRLVGGGPLIAVVGSDGAGKSTLVNGLEIWLERYLAVRSVHLGRPPRSWSTWAIRAALKATSSVSSVWDAASAKRALRMLLATSIARDRQLAYTSALRGVLAGEVVVCDRFPLRELTLMDGPRVEGWAGDRRGRLFRRLVELERRYYDCFTAPDLLIALDVKLETAASRRSDEDGDLLRARWEDVARIDWEGLGAHVFDAQEDAEIVLAHAKRLVWARL